jgi:UDP-N-acetylglucosamine--N-acetylmuramyl-(pentapeptide) pyrophosphoryl-undecaprenol N-acetylglucosamine transferase
MPVRQEFFAIRTRPKDGVLNVLVTGGSQGSHRLNEVMRQSWPVFRHRNFSVRITHQTGSAEFESVRAAFAQTGLTGEVMPFIKDMPAAFADADIVVSRSGAGTTSELAAAGKPAILVPFAFAADDHQTRNAEAMQNAGAARMARDSEINGERLVNLIEELAPVLDRMCEAARRLARPAAAQRAAAILEEEAARRA